MTTRTRIPASTARMDDRVRIRIAIADDHDLMRTGLRVMLSNRDDIEILWEATSHQQCCAMMDVAVPDILLADPELRAAVCECPAHADATGMVVILLSKSDAAQPAAAPGGPLHLDARAGRRELDRLIGVAILSGGPVPATAEVSGEACPDPDDVEILTLVADGYTNRQIARQLGIGEETVKVRLRSVFARLRVASRSAAVVKAIRLGIIE
ncbi:MAG: response regulator transcription factor [Acidimicrobiia bacterium]